MTKGMWFSLHTLIDVDTSHPSEEGAHSPSGQTGYLLSSSSPTVQVDSNVRQCARQCTEFVRKLMSGKHGAPSCPACGTIVQMPNGAASRSPSPKAHTTSNPMRRFELHVLSNYRKYRSAEGSLVATSPHHYHDHSHSPSFSVAPL